MRDIRAEANTIDNGRLKTAVSPQIRVSCSVADCPITPAAKPSLTSAAADDAVRRHPCRAKMTGVQERWTDDLDSPMNDEVPTPAPASGDARIWASLLEVALTTSLGAEAVTTALIQRWHEQIAAGIGSLQQQGVADRRLDADRSAAALLAGVQGGAVILLATGDPSFLEAAIDDGIRALRPT